MTATKWLVIVVGVAVIAWINWYFFLATPVRSRTSEPQ
jgi:plastocyanin domain-containing protein